MKCGQFRASNFSYSSLKSFAMSFDKGRHIEYSTSQPLFWLFNVLLLQDTDLEMKRAENLLMNVKFPAESQGSGDRCFN